MGSFVGNLFGINDGKGDVAEARGLTQEQLRRLDSIQLPSIEQMRIALQDPELVGLLNAEQLDPSRLEDIRLDPRLREAQMGALSRLTQRATQGLTDEDRAAQELALQEAAAQQMSQRRALEQEMEMRGLADSGTALMAQLQAQQGNANQTRRDALMRMAQGAQQRMAADSQAASLAGQIGQQQFNQEAAVAEARDRIAQANAMNRQDVNAKNLAMQQDIANQRTNLANQQEIYNKGLFQQDFQNRMAKATGGNQVLGNMANQHMDAARAGASAQAGLTNALIGGGALIASKSDKNVKTKINKNPDIEKMLDSLDAYQYEYKNDILKKEPDLKGKHFGIMAQDLEKSQVGKEFVEEIDGIKHIDYGKMASTQMAALANLHARLKRLEGKK